MSSRWRTTDASSGTITSPWQILLRVKRKYRTACRADLFLLMTGSADPTADPGSKDSDRHRKKYRVRSTPDAGDVPEVPADADEPDVQDGSENGGEDVTSRKA